ncbi:MAG: M42 family peptidase [Clostridiales bacterium]|nr:M42 family peptidase [Clostridiales bacterium]
MAVQLKDISEIHAVAGDEGRLREYIKSNINADEITVDIMGNLTAFVRGERHDKKLAVITHMDESGFIVSDFTEKGYIKFKNAGNIDPISIISKRVKINNKIPGVIGMKAIHLQKPDERKNIVKVKDLFIDIGEESRGDAMLLVDKGDYLTLDTEFREIGGMVKGKALSRAGVYCLMRAMEKKPRYDTYFVFTVQKEIGSRGAAAAAHRIDADLTVLADTVPSTDMYGVKESRGPQLNEGVIIECADKKMIGDTKIVGTLNHIAEKNNIKHQIKSNTDVFGDFALQYGAGAKKCAAVKIPVRYADTPVQLAALSDIEAACELLRILINGDDTDGIIE